MNRFALALLLSAFCASAACDGARPDGPPIAAGSASVTLGGKKLEVTLTTTEKDRRHAVPRLVAPGETQGHLLAWPRERFMKIESEHSPVSYDVLFLSASGTVVDLARLQDHDPEGVMPKTPAAYALLVAAGLPEKLGVKAGDKATLSAEVLNAKPEELALMKINGVPAHVELALTEDERQHGLMFRPRMLEDDGMLFAYPFEDDHSFWMKNTLIPLDIAFFTEDGTLLNVNETPTAKDPRVGPWPPSPSKGKARYVLEMNLGWFKRKGIVDGSGKIAPGSKAEIPPAAVKGAVD